MYREALWQARKAVDWCELEDLGEDRMKEERKMYLESLAGFGQIHKTARIFLAA